MIHLTEKKQTREKKNENRKKKTIVSVKMDSQKDLFEDQSQSPRVQGANFSSMPSYLYKDVVLFQWNIKENSSRFKVFDRKLFPEIKDSWIKGQLKSNSRMKKLKNLTDDGDVFSLFAKIESGKSKKYNMLYNISKTRPTLYYNDNYTCFVRKAEILSL